MDALDVDNDDAHHAKIRICKQEGADVVPQWAIELAELKDDEAVRELLQEMPMPGPIRVAFTRDPSIFDALDVTGRYNEIVVGRDADSGLIAMAGTRSIKTAYINGISAPLGYLGNLRLREEYRNGLGLARGYRFFRRLHRDGRATLYLTTIAEDNESARKILTSGRGSLPPYHPYGAFYGMAIDLRQRLRCVTSGFDLQPAREGDLPEVIEFLRREGPKKQFFPDYTMEDFQSENGLLRGLCVEDVLLCRTDGELIGVAAAWDQSAFRQIVVAGYHPLLGALRPVYNVVARISGTPLLLPPGSELNTFSLSLVCVRKNDPEIFAALVSEIIGQNRSRHDVMIAGLHERDPLLSVLQQYRHHRYLSRVYVVHWPEEAEHFDELDERIPYLELGSL